MSVTGSTQRSPFDIAAIGLSPSVALGAMLVLSWILPAEILTALFGAMLLAYLLLSPSRANGAALRIALPFLVMMLWGIALSRGNDIYLVGKDAWYAAKVCLCLMLGFLAGIRMKNTDALPKLLIFLGGAMAVVTLLLWVRNGTRIGELDGEDAARIPLVATVAIIPLLDLIRNRPGLVRARSVGILGLILLAVIASNSRITLIAAAVMVLSWTGLFSRTRRALIGGALVIAALVLLWQFLPEYQGGELTVAVKLRRSLEEILLTDSVDPTQMILNWRGFEAYNAQLMFDQSSLVRKFVGEGLGATVDLGQDVVLNDAPIRFLPILHNGYYYLLIKYGIIGVLLYIVSVVRFGWLGKFSTDNLAIEDRMLRGSIITLLLATMVITGMYNKTELNGMMILVGWLIGIAQRHHHDATMYKLYGNEVV